MNEADPRTTNNRFRWRQKPALRQIYTDLYQRMAAACVPGRTLEIGGGSGNFKEFRGDVISSDISFAPWLDFVSDAQRLSVASHSFANIVMFDVLHHIEYPRLFLQEASRVLLPKGRLIMIEPAITMVSAPLYRLLHAEPVRMGDDPFEVGEPNPRRDVFESNQAIPTLIVGRYGRRFRALFPTLQIRQVEWLSLFAYPLSGGFQAWSAIPAISVPAILKFEAAIAPIVGRFMGFRMLIVMESVA